MFKTIKAPVAAAVALALAPAAFAGTDTWFTPLTESASVTLPNSAEEASQPWVAPAGVTQAQLTSLAEVESAAGQSVVRVPGLGRNASMFDMVAYDPTGRYVFIPHETLVGAGVSRYDTVTDTTMVLFAGDLAGLEGDWSNDYAAFDPSTFTPEGTLLLAEEWAGEGRVIEVLNPLAPVEDIKIRELDSIPNTAHEGLRFSADGSALYFVDEWNSGAVYKAVWPGEGRGKGKSGPASHYDKKAQVFVLVVDDYAGEANLNWNEGSNATATRTGLATWVPMTNPGGKPLTQVSPFRNGPTNDPNSADDTRGGRPAADELGATPYGRPEDAEVGKLANGNEVLYFAATSERIVYSVEELGDDKAMVRVFAGDAETPKNVGYAGTTAAMNSPDNLAQDVHGNIYIIEDAPNGSSTGGDVWFARDVDGDGVAESVDHFLSLRVAQSEATGLIFNPVVPTEFMITVQHPESTDLDNVTDGIGDSLWKFDLSGAGFPTP
ncbi:DUF839 domain-containing protein [Marinihelvus fidelis]|uniref:DUF839 domain-containing protein n=1 Tax=Marinihelvus fidelis TaxID=2613842 RepID=A0A5N0TEJ0_9GAMM|nr:alkaline phosphatase PhoX [Marinihelvus fidelis]KAA9133400.1 DUF839 domain-containing protein [Marinihelvus fidelis]